MIIIHEEKGYSVGVTKQTGINVKEKIFKFFYCEKCGNKQSIPEDEDFDEYIKLQTCYICKKVLCNQCKRYEIPDKINLLDFQRSFCFDHNRQEGE